jgi:hypothetical protein
MARWIAVIALLLVGNMMRCADTCSINDFAQQDPPCHHQQDAPAPAACAHVAFDAMLKSAPLAPEAAIEPAFIAAPRLTIEPASAPRPFVISSIPDTPTTVLRI